MEALYERMFEALRRMIPGTDSDSDGMGGAEKAAYGDVFCGALVPMRAAERKDGPGRSAGGRYRLAAEKTAALRYGDTVRRERDGALFRIVGEPSAAPAGSLADFIAAEAEPVWIPRPSGEEGEDGEDEEGESEA